MLGEVSESEWEVTRLSMGASTGMPTWSCGVKEGGEITFHGKSEGAGEGASAVVSVPHSLNRAISLRSAVFYPRSTYRGRSEMWNFALTCASCCNEKKFTERK